MWRSEGKGPGSVKDERRARRVSRVSRVSRVGRVGRVGRVHRVRVRCQGTGKGVGRQAQLRQVLPLPHTSSTVPYQTSPYISSYHSSNLWHILDAGMRACRPYDDAS